MITHTQGFVWAVLSILTNLGAGEDGFSEQSSVSTFVEPQRLVRQPSGHCRRPGLAALDAVDAHALSLIALVEHVGARSGDEVSHERVVVAEAAGRVVDVARSSNMSEYKCAIVERPYGRSVSRIAQGLTCAGQW